MNRHRELTIPSETTYLSHVRQAVLEVLGGGLFSPSKTHLIALAVDEAVANIMEHAYACERPGGVSGDIQVLLDSNAERFEAVIRDRGMSFDPREAPEVDVRQHVKTGSKGGLGICLMRRIMDEINYSFKQGEQNELQLIKYVDEAAGKAKKIKRASEPHTP